jgi:hypothetical protein
MKYERTGLNFSAGNWRSHGGVYEDLYLARSNVV